MADGGAAGGSGSAEALVVADTRFPEEMSTLRKFYGLPGFDAAAAGGQDVLLTRSAEAGLHRVFWVSAAAAELAILSGVYTVVGAGTAVFELTRARGAACDYRLCSDAAALWASKLPAAGGEALGGRMVWLGKKAWVALLHGPSGGNDTAMPVTALSEAVAADGSGSGVEALGSVGAGCLLLRLEGEEMRPETCVVGWLGAGGVILSLFLFISP